MKVYAFGEQTGGKVVSVDVRRYDWIRATDPKTTRPIWAETENGFKIEVLPGGMNKNCRNAAFEKQADAIKFKNACFPAKIKFSQTLMTV